MHPSQELTQNRLDLKGKHRTVKETVDKLNSIECDNDIHRQATLDTVHQRPGRADFLRTKTVL